MAERKWDGLKAASAFIASIFIPLAVAYIGNEYSSSIEESNREYSAAIAEADRQARYIELAVDILSAEPDTQTPQLREWAVNVINMYAEVEMSSDVREQLQKDIKLERPQFQISQQVLDPETLNRLQPRLRPRSP